MLALMYFRTKTIKGTGLVQLVESYRNAEGEPRQRVVVSLGDASLPETEKPGIARAVENHLTGNRDLLGPDLSEEATGWVTRILQLPELLGIRVTKSTKDRLYLTSDVLYAQRKTLEKTLRAREADIFSLQRSIVLYDVTNTHFEGGCAKNPKARHGKNKQSRNDCRQVAVGMAFDERGLALAHDVFEGNIAESKTLSLMLDRLEMPNEGLKPVVILDAGYASAANISLLKERGLSYLINITRGSRAKYAASFGEGGFEPVPGRSEQELVEVKTIVDPDDAQGRLVLCRSAQRREKEIAMLSKAEARFLKDVAALRERITQGRLKDPATIERKIGRLQKKHPRIVRFYTIAHEKGTLSAARHWRTDECFTSASPLCLIPSRPSSTNICASTGNPPSLKPKPSQNPDDFVVPLATGP